MAKIHEAVAVGDDMTAGQAAHTLKGMAATTSALEVQAAAAALEESVLREETDHLEEQTARIQEALEAVIAVIEGLADWAEADEISAIDSGRRLEPGEKMALETLITELRALLVKSDFEAEDCFDRIKALFGSRPLPELLLETGNQISRLDFKTASECLEDWSKERTVEQTIPGEYKTQINSGDGHVPSLVGQVKDTPVF